MEIRPWNIPATLNGESIWPPTTTEHLISHAFPYPDMSEADRKRILKTGGKYTQHDPPCLGKWCWQVARFKGDKTKYYCAETSFACGHNIDEWMAGGADWESRFELRDTPGRGVGVFSTFKWSKGTILGQYTGVFKWGDPGNPDYNADFYVGPKFQNEGEPSRKINVDAEMCGTWTRFLNHSCNPNTEFMHGRVGSTKVLAVKATKVINPDQEVAIDYGPAY